MDTIMKHKYSVFFIYKFSWISWIVCLKDLNALRDDLMELKPTLFAGVPRVFEKVYEGKALNKKKNLLLVD